MWIICISVVYDFQILDKVGGMRVSRPHHEKTEKETKEEAGAIEDAAGYDILVILQFSVLNWL